LKDPRGTLKDAQLTGGVISLPGWKRGGKRNRKVYGTWKDTRNTHQTLGKKIRRITGLSPKIREKKVWKGEKGLHWSTGRAESTKRDATILAPC